MRIVSLSLALAIAAPSVSTLRQSFYHTGSARLLHKISSRIVRGRRLQVGEADETGFDNEIASWAPMLCDELESDEVQESIASDMEEMGLLCSEISCDDPDADIPNVIINCDLGDTCVESASEEFCMDDTEIQASIGLNFSGESNIVWTECGIYTSPEYMADMGRGCWTVTMTVDLVSLVEDLVEDIVTGEVDPATMSEEDAQEFVAAYTDFTGCSGELDDGIQRTECQCGLCEENGETPPFLPFAFELEFTCNGLTSEECTSFDVGVTGEDYTEDGSGAGSPRISIMKLIPEPDADASETEPVTIDSNTGSRTVDKTPCLGEINLYEGPEADFGSDLDRFVMVNRELYTGPDLENLAMTADGICNSLGDGRFLCNIIASDEFGTTTLMGISGPGMTSTFTFTGGTDEYAGVVGRVTNEPFTIGDASVFVNKVCIQGLAT